MRALAEILGVVLILIGAYYGGRDILDRWVNGPKTESKRKRGK